MLPQLSRPFTRLEAQKSALAARFFSMPESYRHYATAPGEWCALQILDHLVLTEAAILDAMIRSIPQRHPVSTGDRFRGRMIELLLLTPARVKVPPKAAHVLPKGNSTLEAHTASWDFLRRRMRETLDQVDPDSVAHGAFQHPVSGRMDLPQTLRFLSAHLVHHGYQLRRQVRAAGRHLPAA